jgi:hypothetical protein
MSETEKTIVLAFAAVAGIVAIILFGLLVAISRKANRRNGQ